MCHRSVTGVTCDTTRCGSGQCPPFRAEPTEAKKKATGKEYTCRKEIPFLEQKLEKRKGTPQSTESPASLDRPIGAIFECLIGSKRPVYTSQLQYSVKVATSSYTVQLKYMLVYPGSYM